MTWGKDGKRGWFCFRFSLALHLGYLKLPIKLNFWGQKWKQVEKTNPLVQYYCWKFLLIENTALAFVVCPPSLVHDGLRLIQLMANKAASDCHWFPLVVLRLSSFKFSFLLVTICKILRYICIALSALVSFLGIL